MATSQHLYRKGDVFYARFRVPTRLLPVLDQRELRWSLQTSTLKTAQKHLLIASVLIREFFEQASMEIAHKPLTESEKIAIRAELEKLKFTKLAEFKALISQGDSGIIEAQRLLTAEKPLIQAFVQAIDARSFDTPEVVGSSQELLPVVDRLAYDFSSKNPNFNFLANEYCSSMLLQHRAKAALLRHEFNRDIAAPTPAETTQPSIAQKTNGPRTTPISKVLDEYLADLEGKGLRGKSIQEYRGVLGKLVSFLSDRPIEDVRRSDLTSFRSALKRHPAYLSREQRALSFHEVIKLKSDRPLSDSSINKHMERIAQFWTWAERSEYDVKASSAQGMLIKTVAKESEQRDRFSDDDLKRLFSTPDFMGKEKFHRAAYYWVPIIGLFSGMRLEEICQLEPNDIHLDTESDTYVIDCNEESPDKKLKTRSSKRTIPVHSRLVALGLIEYVQFVRSKHHAKLFPTLNQHPKNGYSHAVSKWFSSHKTALGFGSKQVFHSLRHTVADHLKQTEQSAPVVDNILGHASNGSENKSRYGKDYVVSVMKPVIESLDFDIPAVPFTKVLLIDTEKTAIRSETAARALRDKRQKAKATEDNA